MAHFECTEDRFLEDVANHKLKILKDDGVMRHLRFAQPDTYNMSFNLTTWPGALAFNGDMGTFVFERLEDMFQFFRARPEDGERVPINVGYWMEKCEAQDTRCEGMREFDPEGFREHCREYWSEHFEDRTESEEAKECWTEIEDRVLSVDPNEVRAYDALNEFEHEGFEFRDAWEWRLTRPTYRMLWCLYAICWGIQQYDAAKNLAQATA